MADSDITILLAAVSEGGPQATAELYAVVYHELKALAHKQLRNERPDHTLGATALVHEAFLKLVDGNTVPWEGQAHFFGVASQAMRRILVDHARRRTASKRSRQQQVTLDADTPIAAEKSPEEILAVDDALRRFYALDPRAAQQVELRFFGGRTIEDAALILGISTATAKRDWTVARAWLQRDLG